MKAAATKPQRGCYLLHFQTPFGHARHYLGYADNIERRVGQHLSGTGANLTARALETGTEMQLVRTWPDKGRQFERQLKRRGSRARHCPLCKGDSHYDA